MTYEARSKDTQGTQCMRQHSQTKDTDMSRTNDEIPEEISSSHRANETTSAGISIDPFERIHVPSLPVCRDYPQGQDVDQRRLQKRNHADIPVDASLSSQILVDGGEEPAAQRGRDDGLNGLVEREGQDRLVDVIG